jgi:hypothetical protein
MSVNPRSLFSKFFSVVGVVTTLAVCVFMIVVGVQHFQTFPWKHVDRPIPLVEGQRIVEFSPSSPIPPNTVMADRIILEGQGLEFPSGAFLFANHIELRPSTVIRGDNIRLVAVDISGGRIDATGTGVGGKGGRIFISAIRLSHMQIDAIGADGAAGASGRDGQDGRNGSCNGFGGYRGADVGMSGADGGNGQNGGDGGSIVLRVAEMNDVQLRSDGGAGGLGGPGGRGGHGGRGCVGLGGAQPSQGDGQPGRQGAAGMPGKRYEPDVRRIESSELSRAAATYPYDVSKLEQSLIP